MRDQRRQIVGQIGPARRRARHWQCAPARCRAGARYRPQPVRRASPARQPAWHEPPRTIRAVPAPGTARTGDVAATAGRANHRRLRRASCRIPARTPSAYRGRSRRRLRSAHACCRCAVHYARSTARRQPQWPPFRPTSVIICIVGSRQGKQGTPIDAPRPVRRAPPRFEAAERGHRIERPCRTGHAGTLVSLNGRLTDQRHLYGNSKYVPTAGVVPCIAY